VPEKNVGKKIVGKKCEKLFYINTNIETKKLGGKNARNNFSRNTRKVLEKNVGKKSSEKSAKTYSYIHTNIVTKKWELGKTRESIIPETRE